MRRALAIVLALAACGTDDAVFDSDLEVHFDWGPAGQPAPFARPLEYIEGDWVLCRDLACTRVDRFGLRVMEGGHARLLQVSLRNGQLRRCFESSNSFVRWRLEEGVLTVEVDPTIGDMSFRDRTKGNVRFRVELKGEVAFWTLLPADHDRDTVGDVDVPVPVFGALSTSVEGIALRAVRLRRAPLTEECVVF